MPRAALKVKPPETPNVADAWPHQQRSVAFNATRNRAFDNSDPGTGKTAVQVLTYVQRPKKKRWLVVCPKTLMRSAWGEDIERFGSGLTVAYADPDTREAAFRAGTDVVILNTDGVKWLEKNPKLLNDFDHLTIDEYTTFKHASSQRTKAMLKLRKHFTHRYLLSGTPNANSVMELFAPCMILDDGKRLGTSYVRLRNIMQTPEQIGPSPDHLKWSDKPGAAQAVAELLEDITIRHAFRDVMTHVPENFRDTKRFELPKKLRKVYDTVATECIHAFDDETYINAVHAASLRNKLLQIASGAVYTEGTEQYKLVDTTRYELACDLIEETQHSVVFFNWVHQRDFLAQEMDKRGLTFAVIDGSVTKKGERERIVTAFQEGAYRALFLHPRTGAHGLTLTRGDTVIFTSPIYEADLLEQGIARIVRGTQDKVTRTVFIEAKDTVEAKVYDRLNAKNAAMQDLLSMQADRSKK